MRRNGLLALTFHALFVTFILAPIVIVCWVAFTPEGFLSIPTTEFSLRWFRAIAAIRRSSSFMDSVLMEWLRRDRIAFSGGGARHARYS